MRTKKKDRMFKCYCGREFTTVLGLYVIIVKKYFGLNVLIVKMQDICDLVGWNSEHISDIFNYNRANINGMWNARTLGGIYKTFEFTRI